MKNNRIIIFTKFDNWVVPPNVVNLIVKLHYEYECGVYYQNPKKVDMKRILGKRGFWVWFDLMVSKCTFKFLLPLRKIMFGKKNYTELMREKVDKSFNNNENYFEDFATFRYVEDINRDSLLVKDIETNPPLLIVSLGAPILRKKLLRKINDLGILAINSHVGITPDYMGSSPFIWALKKKEFSKIGFTIHKISEKVDYGDYLYRKVVDISDCKNLTDIDWKLLIESSSFLSQKIISGEILQVGSNIHRVDYCSFPPAGFSTILKAFINFQKFVKLRKIKNEL